MNDGNPSEKKVSRHARLERLVLETHIGRFDGQRLHDEHELHHDDALPADVFAP